jgi:beta-xylosidase
VAGTPAQAAALALDAGLDVELPSVACYGAALVTAVREGQVPAELVDRAAARVLRQKCELGLLDPGWSPSAAAADGGDPADAGDPGASSTSTRRRTAALARRLAEESVVLLANRRRVAAAAAGRQHRGDRAAGQRPAGLLRLLQHAPSPGRPVRRGHRRALTSPPCSTRCAPNCPPRDLARGGCAVRGTDRSGFAHAAAHAEEADVVVAVLGDEAGLFGRGTSGEGCDVTDLRLPGVQEDLLRVLVGTGKPVVLVLVTGRPYAIGPLAGARRGGPGVLPR